jgi:hypothetical protein
MDQPDESCWLDNRAPQDGAAQAGPSSRGSSPRSPLQPPGHTRMTQGEILALGWQDLDMKNPALAPRERAALRDAGDAS